MGSVRAELSRGRYGKCWRSRFDNCGGDGGWNDPRADIQRRCAGRKPDWREQNAYTLGVQAYLYAFPWAYMPNARWLRTEAIDRQADRFDHIRHLEDAKPSQRRRAQQRHALFARLGLPQGRAGHPDRAGNRRPLLHHGDRRFHGRQFRLCRHARNGNQGRKLRDRRTRLEGNAARGRDGVAAVIDAVGDDSWAAPT